MQQVWHHRTAQRVRARWVKRLNWEKTRYLSTICEHAATGLLYVLALFLKPPLELVPPPGFLLQLLVDFICVPVETSFYMTCNLPSMMPSYPLAF
jgi:hypothetical protein